MNYLGEKNNLKFRDNYCEPIPNVPFTSASAAEFGRVISSRFKRIAVGCAEEKVKHFTLALCSGISEGGSEVYLCTNTDLPPFKYGLPLVSAECGIYISGSGPKFSFFAQNGFPMMFDQMNEIINAELNEKSTEYGKIVPVPSPESIYTANIRDNIGSAPGSALLLNAGISCGNRRIRALWQQFFNDSDDTLIFQVSDDGQHVNAYSTELGFISHDRLILAFCLMLWKNGQAVYLPEHFHYAAEDMANSHGYHLIHFNSQHSVPPEAAAQRFLNDPLFMCVKIAANREKFLSLLKKVPSFATAQREICTNLACISASGESIIEPKGRVYISESGENRVTLVAQAYETETAAELCSLWNENLRRMSSCTNLFHPRT